MRTGRRLQRSQFPFRLIDHEHLAGTTARPDGTLAIHDQRYTALILPEDSQLPPQTEAVAAAFRSHGGSVIMDRSEAQRSLLDQLQPAFRIAPPSERIALGQFVRDRCRILLAVNVGHDDYDGHLTGQTSGTWHTMDPSTGAVGRCEKDGLGHIPLALAGRQAILLVQTSTSSE
jgi:hypothetical protein